MNDAERDAWLRGALRYAPDADALPPSGVSEAILLKARGRAQLAAPAARRGAVRAAAPPELVHRLLGLARAAAGGRRLRQRDGGDAGRPDVVGPADGRDDAASAGRRERARRRCAAARVDGADPCRRDRRGAGRCGEDAKRRRAPSRHRPRWRPTPKCGAARRSRPSKPRRAMQDRSPCDDGAKLRETDALAKERALPSERKNEAPAAFPSTELATRSAGRAQIARRRQEGRRRRWPIAPSRCDRTPGRGGGAIGRSAVGSQAGARGAQRRRRPRRSRADASPPTKPGPAQRRTTPMRPRRRAPAAPRRPRPRQHLRRQHLRPRSRPRKQRAVERVDHETGIVRERGRTRGRAAASALMRAFAANVVPVSSGSGRPSASADTASTP